MGLESSCDETAVAIVKDSQNINKRIVSNVIFSQIDEHQPFGGVVPEIAARSHLEHFDNLINQAIETAGVSLDQIDGIAATGGPGLIGGVIVGVMYGKSIASAKKKPFFAVNHLEGHALTVRLCDNVNFPYLLLLVSGGHCQLLIAEGIGQYKRLGTTLDDALGESYDKCAKMLGLGYPGGPIVEKFAKNGDGARYSFPRPMLGRKECNFSFSGLKTAVRRQIEKIGPDQLNNQVIADICASFERAVGDVLLDRCQNALNQFKKYYRGQVTLVIAGGVAANQALRIRLNDLKVRENIILKIPPADLCTDNAAMIAWAGIEYARIGKSNALDFKPRPRWPLDPDASKAIGAGIKA